MVRATIERGDGTREEYEGDYGVFLVAHRVANDVEASLAVGPDLPQGLLVALVGTLLCELEQRHGEHVVGRIWRFYSEEMQKGTTDG